MQAQRAAKLITGEKDENRNRSNRNASDVESGSRRQPLRAKLLKVSIELLFQMSATSGMCIRFREDARCTGYCREKV